MIGLNGLKTHTRQHSGQCVNKVTGQVIRAIVPVHIYGHPVDINGLLTVSQDFNIKLVEDAAEALGGKYHGRHSGTFGLMGTLSFNGNKTITTGGGGAILTNDANQLGALKTFNNGSQTSACLGICL